MRKKILIIEDNKILQKSLKKQFEDSGFLVLQLFDGLNVLKIAEKEKPDLVILDLMLPGEDGFHLLKSIKMNGLANKPKVIVLSVIDSESSISECKSLGADDYMEKANYSLDEIVKRVRSHLK